MLCRAPCPARTRKGAGRKAKGIWGVMLSWKTVKRSLFFSFSVVGTELRCAGQNFPDPNATEVQTNMWISIAVSPAFRLRFVNHFLRFFLTLPGFWGGNGGGGGVQRESTGNLPTSSKFEGWTLLWSSGGWRLMGLLAFPLGENKEKIN